MAVLAINGGTPVRTEGWPGWPPDDPGFLENLNRVIESGSWGGNEGWVQRACEMMAEHHGAKYAVACTSGTTALELALRAVGVGVGDEVIVPPYTFIATASSVIAVGAVPIFVDIDPQTFNLDPALIEDAITERTRAITAVHIGGSPADMDAILAVAKQHDLAVIEDCAQAHGAIYQGRKVGALGDAGAFSFQSSKNVTAGEGGMILTNSREIYEQTWSTVNVGRVQDGGWYDHRVMGWNYRLTQFQGALICRGMELLPGHFKLRARNGDYLRERLQEVEGIGLQKLTAEGNVSAFHLYIFTYDEQAFGGLDRDSFLRALGAEGIGAARGYNPLYREGVLSRYFDASKFPFSPRYYDGVVDYSKVSCPACEHVCDRGGFWMSQRIGLADRQAMDDIADAMLKIQQNVQELV